MKWILALYLIGALVSEVVGASFCYEDKEFKPYQLGNEKVPEQDKGVLIEAAVRAANTSGLSLSLYRRPWKRCVLDLKTNKADAILAVIWKPERDSWGVYPKVDGELDPSRSLFHARYMVIHPKGIHVWDGKSFSKLRTGIGAPLGYVVHQMLKQQGALSPKQLAHREGLNLVAKKRLDGYVMDGLIAQRLIAELQLDEALTIDPRPYYQAYLYIPFSRRFFERNPEKVQAFWSQLKSAGGQGSN